MNMNKDSIFHRFDFVSTGIPGLDVAFGGGLPQYGLPKRKIVELFSPSSTMGWRDLGLHLVAQAQKAGGVVAYIDADRRLDVRRASTFGVAVKDLIIDQSGGPDAHVKVIEALVRAGGAVNFMVVDSTIGLVGPEDPADGMAARLWSQWMRRVDEALVYLPVCVLFINPLAECNNGGFVNALRFHAAIRLVMIAEPEPDVWTCTVQTNRNTPAFEPARVKLVFPAGGGVEERR